jgi:hypothetical protein
MAIKAHKKKKKKKSQSKCRTDRNEKDVKRKTKNTQEISTI